MTLPQLLILSPTVHSFPFRSRTFLTGGLLPLAAAVYIFVKMNPGSSANCSPTQTARPLAVARLQPHNAPSFTLGEQFSKELLRSIAPWRSTSSRSAFPCGASSNSSSRDSRSFRWYLPACLLTVRTLLLQRAFGTRPFTVDSRSSHVGASAWFLSSAFWICLQLAGTVQRPCPTELGKDCWVDTPRETQHEKQFRTSTPATLDDFSVSVTSPTSHAEA